MDLVRRLPLWEVADLRAPDGVGDKRILRHLARHLLGLSLAAAALPKRAIQFGSRSSKFFKCNSDGAAHIGLGRIVASCCRSATLYQIH
jgi:hypothetical protein